MRNVAIQNFEGFRFGDIFILTVRTLPPKTDQFDLINEVKCDIGHEGFGEFLKDPVV